MTGVEFCLQNITLLVTTVFIGFLDFQHTMGYSVFCQRFADSIFNVVCVSADLQMHGGAVLMTVDAPNVNVVYIGYLRNLQHNFMNFRYANAIRRSF